MKTLFDTFDLFDTFAQTTQPLSYNKYLNESDDGFELEIPIVGVKKADISVTVEDNVLNIKWDRKISKKYLGLPDGEFNESFKLGKTIDVENISSIYVDGILTVTIPKIEKKIEVINVKVK